MRLRSTVATALLAAGLAVPLATGTAAAAGLRCDDLPSQAAAQAALDADPAGAAALDQDGDGRACEDTDFTIARVGSPTPVHAELGAAATAVPGQPAENGGGPLRYVLGGLAVTVAGGLAAGARRQVQG